MYYTELLFYFSCSCKDGRTALYAAASNGNVECLQALLSAGADIHVQNKVSTFIFADRSSYANNYNNSINTNNTIINIRINMTFMFKTT